MNDKEVEKKPNFIILFPDEQRYDTIAAAGFPWMITPNLDRLVREGCLFPNGHTPNPVCVPARHSLLTGASCRDHGFFSNQGDRLKHGEMSTLPRSLSAEGYYTALVGKAHFSPVREHHGFDDLFLMEEIPDDKENDQYLQYLDRVGLGDRRAIHGIRPYLWNAPQKSTIPDEHHGSKWVADTCIDLIKKNKDRPFFLQCGFIAPHPPFNVPDSVNGIYQDRDIPSKMPVNRQDPYYQDETHWAGDFDDLEAHRQVQEAYLSMITHVDEQVGRILDVLESLGELDRTFIIFTSDHGEMLGDHGLWGKMKPHEGSCRIPFIVRYPKTFVGGSVDSRFVDLCDVFPTVLDVAGIDACQLADGGKYLVGDSILKKSSEVRDFDEQWCEFGELEKNRWIMLKSHRYKYVYFYHGGIEYFYDLVQDPNEQCNLVGIKELPIGEFSRLKMRCMELELKHGPRGAVEQGDFISFEHQSTDDPRSTEKHVLCGFSQLPSFGKGSSLEEAELFATDFKRATEDWDMGLLKSYAPSEDWLEAWRECFLEHGGSEEIFEEMMR